MPLGRWENCVSHYDHEVLDFFKEYFSDSQRNCLLIGGAGFDPRSTDFLKQLSVILGDRLAAFLIREERPEAQTCLVKRAEKNLQEIEKYCSDLKITKIDIFADDGAVVGGKNTLRSLSSLSLSQYTDVIIDMSALSMGISFPLTSYVFNAAKEYHGKLNVHLAVVSNPALDGQISSMPNDRVSDVAGFLRRNLYGESEVAQLWLPQVSENKKNVLGLLYNDILPHDTCPILPFPSADPTKADRTAFNVFSSVHSEWGGPLENDWGLDPKNFVHADENRPLDIYRTILRIDDERRPVFEAFGGSHMILSPLGSKIPSMGALLAALERCFPVVYVEALTYDIDWDKVDSMESDESRMVHIWLFGEAYLGDMNAGADDGKCD